MKGFRCSNCGHKVEKHPNQKCKVKGCKCPILKIKEKKEDVKD